jgi:hypothetical protein
MLVYCYLQTSLQSALLDTLYTLLETYSLVTTKLASMLILAT